MRKIEYKIGHVNGLYFEITNDEGFNDEYDVSFIDRSKNEVVYELKMKPNTWAKLTRKYLSDIVVVVKMGYETLLEVSVLEKMRGNRVFISFESSSLGDTIAWMPSCELFRMVYGCELIVSTFKNELFENQYPEIQFVERGVEVDNLYALFQIGWMYNPEREPVNPATIPLQKAANNILFLNTDEELLPKLNYKKSDRPIRDKYVCISTKSTAQLKEWYYWQELIDWLISKGYKVVELSKEECYYDGIERIEDKSLQNVMNYLYHSEFYIGLSSGISWLAWGLRKKVYMIANFSLPNHEFQNNCIRIVNHNVCHGCWNNTKFKFDKSNWNYCPEHEDTPRQFECHKLIPASEVIRIIEEQSPSNIF